MARIPQRGARMWHNVARLLQKIRQQILYGSGLLLCRIRKPLPFGLRQSVEILAEGDRHSKRQSKPSRLSRMLPRLGKAKPHPLQPYFGRLFFEPCAQRLLRKTRRRQSGVSENRPRHSQTYRQRQCGRIPAAKRGNHLLHQSSETCHISQSVYQPRTILRHRQPFCRSQKILHRGS